MEDKWKIFDVDIMDIQGVHLMDIQGVRLMDIESVENYSTNRKHPYTIYDMITMPMWEATELLIDQCKKIEPDMDLVRDLFEYAVLDVNLQNRWGLTALTWASRWGHTEIIRMLLERPEIDKTLKSKSNKTAWDLANEKVREKCPELKPT